LRHTELLDAAHIVPDYAGGPLVVTNGVALCKIHHAAYDSNIMGIRPDYVTEVRSDLLDEKDGPMLLHGLQEVHDQRIYVPKSPAKRPSVEALEQRYEQFRVA
jgi:putative restriction endonuclease